MNRPDRFVGWRMSWGREGYIGGLLTINRANGTSMTRVDLVAKIARSEDGHASGGEFFFGAPRLGSGSSDLK
jgi:hypothetical protein